jgi:hypothetical protein
MTSPCGLFSEDPGPFQGFIVLNMISQGVETPCSMPAALRDLKIESRWLKIESR